MRLKNKSIAISDIAELNENIVWRPAFFIIPVAEDVLGSDRFSYNIQNASHNFNKGPSLEMWHGVRKSRRYTILSR